MAAFIIVTHDLWIEENLYVNHSLLPLFQDILVEDHHYRYYSKFSYITHYQSGYTN